MPHRSAQPTELRRRNRRGRPRLHRGGTVAKGGHVAAQHQGAPGAEAAAAAGAPRPGRVLRRVARARLETIKGLQRQGFNLVSIEAMLGTHRRSARWRDAGDADRQGGDRSPRTAVRADQARGRRADRRRRGQGGATEGAAGGAGTAPDRAAADRGAAAAVRTAGQHAVATQHLVEAAGTRLLALRGKAARVGRHVAPSGALSQGLVNVLAEVLRISVENRARTACRSCCPVSSRTRRTSAALVDGSS